MREMSGILRKLSTIFLIGELVTFLEWINYMVSSHWLWFFPERDLINCLFFRIVEIKGIEANMCCGTHVSNLAHLQMIKLLSAEKGKKGKTNVYFLAGDRVLNYAAKSYASEKELTKHLKVRCLC